MTVIRTLHWYLSRELLKVTGLALIAFTLVMTVFAIVEPLRKQGLSSDQVISLFGYTLPVMLSLTLPVAALFAATIVYGRFSQDNELLACRASGIATFSLLKPAIVLGMLVTIASLGLSNFLAPKLARMGANAVRENVRNIAFHQLRAQGFIKFGPYIVHADSVDVDSDMLGGVVAADTKNPNEVQLVVASAAKVRFYERDGEWYVGFSLAQATGGVANRPDTADMGMVALGSLPIPSSVIKEKVSVYDWGQLVRTLNEPYNHPEIQRSLRDIRRRIYHGMVARDVAGVINLARRPYDKFSDGRYAYRLVADVAKLDEHGSVKLHGTQEQRVTVTQFQDGNEVKTFTAGWADVQANWSAMSNVSLVTITLMDDVRARLPAEGDQPPRRLGDKHDLGDIKVPQDVTQRAQEISLDSIYKCDRPEDLELNHVIYDEITDLRTRGLRVVLGSVIAEIHGRIAYGVSCFLLVALGAALGLLFRGGQLVSAFAIAAIPAAFVIVMIIMGKEMTCHPNVPMVWGLTAIWAGIVLLLGANVCVYAYLMRR
jgi:lipopolysaccharide export LptBFGC system permease protein LptF